MPTRTIPVLLAALALALPQRARADSCELPSHRVVAPADGAVDVPTNAKIWVGFADWDIRDVVLLGPGDIEPDVEFGIELVGETKHYTTPTWNGTALTIWTPVAPLEPNTDYQVWSCEGASCSTMEAAFRTGDGPSSAPPPVPEVISAAGDRRGRCDPETITMQLAGEGIFVVDFAEDDPDADHEADGLLVSPRGDIVLPAPRTGDISLRVGAHAIDGSFSGWSEPVAVSVGGCSIDDGPRPPALLALLLLVVRRRRSVDIGPHAQSRRS